MLVLLLAPVALYALAAVALAFVPVNAAFVPATGGVTIYLRSNGFHADIVVPARTPAHDFTAEFPPSHFAALASPRPWIAFGWGDRDFMVETPTWRDLKFVPTVRALLGIGRGAMHVEYVRDPAQFDARAVRLDAAQYARLVAALRAGFARDAAGTARRIDHGGFGPMDAFYESTVDWNVLRTCNEWVRGVLSDAGVRTAAWAPFAAPLFWQLDRVRDQAAGTSAGRRSNMPQPSIDITFSSRWLKASQRNRVSPTVGRLELGLASITSRRTRSVSPG